MTFHLDVSSSTKSYSLKKVDDELDRYKCSREDRSMVCAKWDSFSFITLVGQKVKVTDNTPKTKQKYIGFEGTIIDEPKKLDAATDSLSGIS